jgi:hypothetical protein
LKIYRSRPEKAALEFWGNVRDPGPKRPLSKAATTVDSKGDLMGFSTQVGAISFKLCLGFLVFLVHTSTALGAEDGVQGIPNSEIHSAYANGNEVIYNFQDGKLEYRFVAGGMKGAFNKDLDFVSKRIDDDIYLVSWHDTRNAFYMTLVLDLKNNKEYFTSIIGYANETPQTNFLEAEIVSFTLTD